MGGMCEINTEGRKNSRKNVKGKGRNDDDWIYGCE
jgi:hypothetical protein